MTTAESIAQVYRDLAHPSANNDRLPRTTILGMLNQAEVEFAKLTKCLRRSVVQSAVSGQATYAFPQDAISVQGGLMGWGSWATPLIESTDEMQSARSLAWASATTTGNPTAFIPKAKQFIITPTPTFGHTLDIVYNLHIQPFTCGESIVSIERVSDVTTVVTTGNHGLAVGDKVGIHGVTATGSESASPSASPSPSYSSSSSGSASPSGSSSPSSSPSVSPSRSISVSPSVSASLSPSLSYSPSRSASSSPSASGSLSSSASQSPSASWSPSSSSSASPSPPAGDADFEQESVVVTSVPTLTSFTYGEIGDDASGTGGVVYYAGGHPPLVLDDDVPAIPTQYHAALAGYAVAFLGAGFLSDDGEMQSKMTAGLSQFTDAVSSYNARLF